MQKDEFLGLLEKELVSYALKEITLISQFRELVLAENERQNLTRLTKPKDFIEGHVLDAVFLLKSGYLKYPALDLGSGGGFPGVICAVLELEPWILAESEKSKALFLSAAIQKLKLSNVSVHCGRGEDYLYSVPSAHPIQTLVARAVGSVSKIYSWIKKCSTWNSLVLLKGPSWGQEWQEFLKKHKNPPLKILDQHPYEIGKEKKKRVIIQLVRTECST